MYLNSKFFFPNSFFFLLVAVVVYVQYTPVHVLKMPPFVPFFFPVCCFWKSFPVFYSSLLSRF